MKTKNIVTGALSIFLLYSTNVFAGDPFLGANVYNEHCVRCHGANGTGIIAGTPDFLQPSFLAKPDFELKAFISAGKGIMPSYQGILKEREIMDVIAYIRTFN
ncbi:MAG: cytochrome c [Gammaproteobacteria bacterium]|jgi:cytochrome c6|nr:cytochrome c [Gammaproteobacteria bacterium]